MVAGQGGPLDGVWVTSPRHLSAVASTVGVLNECLLLSRVALRRLSYSPVPPLFPPGAGWSYSNTNYILAGLIMLAATGHSPQSELGRRIFTPLGLHGTSFPVTERGISGYHAHGYLLPGYPFPPTSQPLDAVTCAYVFWHCQNCAI